MLEYGFNEIVVIQAVDTTDNSVVNLCMSRAIDNSRGIVLLNKETVCDYICLILSELTKEEVMGALNKVLMTYKPCMAGDIYMITDYRRSKQVNLVFCFLLFISFTHIACESSMGFFYLK